MEERYLVSLERIVSLIENSLGKPPQLEELSREAGLSKYHLHRVFRAITGFPLAEYIRRRRISESLKPLLDSEKPIIDIALDCGFGYEQSYIRAFKSCFQMCPGRCRLEKPLLPLTERVNIENLVAIGTDGALLAPRLVTKPATIICGVRHWVHICQNRKENTVSNIATNFFFNDKKRIDEPLYANRYVGIVEYSHDKAHNWYVTGAELKGKPVHAVPDGMEFFPLKSQKYREFVHISRVHPFMLKWNDVMNLYNEIFKVWMPRNKEKVSQNWHMEYVDTSTAREDYGEFRVLVPVI